LRGSLGRAVLACCRPAVLAGRPRNPPPVRSLTHREVQDICEQGLHLRVGKRSLSLLSMDDAVERFDVPPPPPETALSGDGMLALCVLHDGEYAGAVTFVNEPLHDAAEALAALRLQGIGQTYMITHEAEVRVHPGLRQLGFTDWRCELDEIAKLRFIDDLVNRGLRVALVSDGLFQASGDCLNICLSTMPEARQLQADVWLLRPELTGLVAARELASRSARARRRSHLTNLAANGSILLAGSFNLLSPTLAAVMSNAVTLGMIRGAMKIKEEG
jgi:cation transport ATPase